MLRSDLKAARADWIAEARNDEERQVRSESDFLRYRNAAGEVADFHSTRHTFISGIVAGGASVKVAQELARHSTPTLTIGRYSHTRLHDVAAALDSLPDLDATQPVNQPAMLAATGTDGKQLTSSAHRQQNRQQLGGEWWRRSRIEGERWRNATRSCAAWQIVTVCRVGNKKTTVGERWRRVPPRGVEPRFSD